MQEETNEKEDEITDENIVDLQQFVPVGGVYHIDALQLPPQVKQVKNWNMVEVSEKMYYTSWSLHPLRAVLELFHHSMYAVYIYMIS